MSINGGIQRFLIFNCLFLGLVGACSQFDRQASSHKSSQFHPQETELMISAAASMQGVLEEIRASYNRQFPHVKLVFNFGSSGSLQHQIEQGAPVDIFISAAPQQMNYLADKLLLLDETRYDLVKNQMVLVVPRNNGSIDSFADLTQQSVEQIALGELDSVPAGNYAREILTNLKIFDAVRSKAVYAKDVRQVFNYVATGNTDAGIVYRTDALNTKRVQIVDTAPEGIYSPVVYPAAIVKDSKNIENARQLLQFLRKAEVREIFERHGFIPLG